MTDDLERRGEEGEGERERGGGGGGGWRRGKIKQIHSTGIVNLM